MYITSKILEGILQVILIKKLTYRLCYSSLMLQDTFADKATERKILSLLIACPSEGCQWTGELRSKDVSSNRMCIRGQL